MPYPAGRFFKRKNQEIPQRVFLDFGAQRGSGGYNVVNLSRKSANYKFTRMKKPFVIP